VSRWFNALLQGPSTQFTGGNPENPPSVHVELSREKHVLEFLGRNPKTSSPASGTHLYRK